MISAILNSAMLDSDTAILDSDTLLSSLRFTQKHSPSILTLTQTNSIWLTWWWQPSRILPSWIQPFPQKKLPSCILTQIDDGSHLEFCHLGFSHLPSCSFWLNLIGSHLEICLSAFPQKNFTHAFSLNFMMATILKSAIMDLAILHKKTSLIHSHSTWWWQPSWILPSWI